MSLGIQKSMLVLAVAASLFAGCGPSTTAGSFKVTASSGLTPTITWDVAEGGALGLAVSEFPGTSVNMWVLSGSGIVSGVKYGTVPAGAYEAKGAAKPLVAGQQYDITITTSGTRSGNGQFTP